jgi:hypothetical protein
VVETEAIAEVHRDEIERADGGRGQFVHERIAPRLIGRGLGVLAHSLRLLWIEVSVAEIALSRRRGHRGTGALST